MNISDHVPTITFVDGRTLRTYKGVTIDITPNPVPVEVEAILKKVGDGDLDAYDVLNSPKTEHEVDASRIIQRLYDAKCEGGQFHPDDDFEEILAAVCEDLQKDYA